MAAVGAPPAPRFEWDLLRDTRMGRYLAHRELTFIRQFVSTDSPPRRVLDIGCGTGRMTHPLHEQGLRVMGLDLSQEALARFKRAADGVPLVCSDGTRLPFDRDSFDCIVSLQSIDYVDHRAFLQEC